MADGGVSPKLELLAAAAAAGHIASDARHVALHALPAVRSGAIVAHVGEKTDGLHGVGSLLVRGREGGDGQHARQRHISRPTGKRI